MLDRVLAVHAAVPHQYVGFNCLASHERIWTSCGARMLCCVILSRACYRQITSKQDQRYLDLNWHHSHAFLMAPWTALESSGRMLYVQLNQNHRLPLEQFKMLCRVSCHVTMLCAGTVEYCCPVWPCSKPLSLIHVMVE